MKKIFGVLGALGFLLLIYFSGWQQVWADFLKVGWGIFPLCLTFLPTLALYALGWYLVTPNLKSNSKRGGGFKAKSIGFLDDQIFFTLGSLLGVAWNNLTPFAKVGGEVVRALYLSKRIPRPRAIASVLTYNLTHLVGAFFSFVVAGVLILLFWQPPESTKIWIVLGIIASLIACVISVSLPILLGTLQKRNRKKEKSQYQWLSWVFAKLKSNSGGIIFLYAVKQNHYFFKNHGLRWILAVVVEVIARFVEGLTFYYAFKMLGTEVPLLKAFAYDVARTFSDTLFFFVPYSLGSREVFLNLLMKEVYGLPVALAVSSSVIYRLVELVWTGLGYWLWMRVLASLSSGKRPQKA